MWLTASLRMELVTFSKEALNQLLPESLQLRRLKWKLTRKSDVRSTGRIFQSDWGKQLRLIIKCSKSRIRVITPSISLENLTSIYKSGTNLKNHALTNNKERNIWVFKLWLWKNRKHTLEIQCLRLPSSARHPVLSLDVTEFSLSCLSHI